MAKKRQSIEDKLEALADLLVGSDSGDSEVKQQVLLALADKHYRVVAKAAALCSDLQFYEHEKALSSAYQRFLQDPLKRDPNCIAKAAIVRALVALDYQNVVFFLAGLRYRQLEPVWGGFMDTAIDVRCQCAMGLVASGYPRALPELTILLNDAEAPVRLGAVRAIVCGQPREAELLLRFKGLSGDEEPEIIGECLSGLLSIEPEESLPFVAEFLKNEDDVICQLAALALGESRLAEALPVLKTAWDDVVFDQGFKTVLIRAVAMHRSEEAFDWLLGLVEQVSVALTEEIITALAAYHHNAKLANRLQAAVCKRGEDALI